MSDIVQRLRESATQARAIDRAALLNEAADQIERLRLTDAERESVCYVAGSLDHLPFVQQKLRGLLDRLQ